MNPNQASLNADSRLRVRRRELLLDEALADPSSTDFDTAVAFGELGKVYLAFGYPESSINCFLNAHSLSDRVYLWPHYLTIAQTQLGDSEGAIDAAQSALRLKPDSVPTLVLLGDACLTLNRNENAREAYSKAVKLHPGCSAAWYGLGKLALSQDDFESAVHAFETALRLQPEASMMRYPLGMAYRGIGEIEKAKEQMTQQGVLRPVAFDPLVVDLETLNVQTWIKQGSDALRAGRPDKAVRILSRAVVAEPGDYSLRINLGLALARVGDEDGAFAQYIEALEIEPENYSAYTHLGTLLASMDRRDEASAYLRQAIELNPLDYHAHYNLGKNLRVLGNDAEALIHIEKVIQLDPSHEMARAARARILAAFGRCEAAATGVEEGLDLLPDSLILMDVLARLLSACPSPQIRDPERAIKLATRAFEREQIIQHAVTLALAHGAAGNFDLAIQWQQLAIGLLPDQAGAEKTREKLTDDLARYQRRISPIVEW